MEWQPISTAPDLTEVLVYNSSNSDCIVAVQKDGTWLHGWEPLLRMADKTMPFNPTHWMPLPAPPTKPE